MSGEPVIDEELVAALRRGELDAFDRLYDRYHRRLFGYIRRLIPERALAEDLFQDVFFKVLRDRSYDPARGRFAAWLFTMARNRCLQERRKLERRAEKVARAGAPALGGPSPEQAVVEGSRVRAAMDGLSEPQRQLLLLKQVGELTYAEIAALLGIAEGTVKSRLHAATLAFRARLVELGEG